MKRYIHFTLIITILRVMFQTTVYAQTPNNLPYIYNFDSLVNVNLQYKKQDLQKLKLLNAVTYGYTNINPSKGIETGDQAISLAKKINNVLLLAEAYNNKGLNYFTKSEYSHALDLYEKALAINQSNNNTYGIAYNTCNIGENYTGKGNYKQANDHFEQALKLFENINDMAGIAECNNQIGSVFVLLSNYLKGLEYFKKALAINEQIGNITGVALNLSGIGNVYFSTSDYTKALDFQQRALAINEHLVNKKAIAGNFHNIGNVYLFNSDYVKALDYFQRAFVINEHLGNKAWLANNLSNIGIVYRKLSDNSKALEYYQKAFLINEKLVNKVGMARNLTNFGIIYSNLSDYTKALEYYHKALAINEQLEDKSGMATNLGNIGILYQRLADYTKALEYYQKALIINEQLGIKINIATNLGNIGALYLKISDYPKALEYSQKALLINEQIGNKNQLAINLGNIGVLYENISDYPKALEYAQKALALHEQIGALGAMAGHLLNLGRLYYMLPDSLLLKLGFTPSQRYEKALEYQFRSLRLVQEIGDVSQQKLAWMNINVSYEKKGDFVKAYDAFRNYIVLRDSIESGTIKQKIQRKEMQYEFDKKETEYLFQQQLSAEKLLRSTQEALLSQQQLRLSNKEKDLVHLAYLKEKAEKQQNENRLALSEKEKQLQLASIRSLGKEKDLQKSALQLSQAELKRKNLQRNGFIVGMLLFLALSFFIYRNFVSQRRSNQLISEALLNLKNTQAQLILAENQKNSALEKARIARDMHDDIGSGLTRIAFMTEFLKSGSNVNKKQIDEIANTANELVDNMSQIIWAMNPENDKLENLFGYLRKYSLDFFENSPIKCNVSIEGDLGSVVLTQSIKRNLFLVIKELLNNVLKHSKATKVSIKALQEGDILKISISDNGVGFDPETASKSGNGLNNMQKRMQEINSNMKVISSPGNGTTTVLYCNCTKNKNV